MGSEEQTSHYFTERGRQRERREMYFQIILLITPAFGMPSKAADVGGEVANKLQSFIDFSAETGDLLENSDWIQEVFVSLENTERNLLDLEVELKTMPYADMTGLGFEGNLFPEYNEAKRYLRETGQKLREFAYKTVAEARDLKTLFEAFDESKDSVLLHIAIEKLTGFMSETLEKFEEANEKYRTAKNTFVDLKNFSTEAKEKVEELLNKDSAEHQHWVTVVRKAVREESNVPEQVRNLEAKLEEYRRQLRLEIEEAAKAENEKADTKIEKTEIKKTDAEMKKEIDEQIHTALVKGINMIEERVEANIQAAIKRYNDKLENLKKLTDSILESGENFEETIDSAMNILTEKIAKITLTTESANLVSENKEKFLAKYEDISSDLTTELDDLKKSAETFLAKD